MGQLVCDKWIARKVEVRAVVMQGQRGLRRGGGVLHAAAKAAAHGLAVLVPGVGLLEEAAEVAGAKVGDIVCSVLVPLLKPAMLYAWIWMALLTYRELTLPVLLSSNDNLPVTGPTCTR